MINSKIIMQDHDILLTGMMSKPVKLIAAGLIVLATAGWAWWQLKPKPKVSTAQKEISIKPADLPTVSTTSYEDWSGFKFDYPDILTVKEIELDNPQVYSSLELTSTDGKRLTIRVTDADAVNLLDWQKTFNRQNSVRTIDQTTLAGLPAIRLQYGAPEMVLTAAIDQGIIYQVQSNADDGFWDRTHEDLVASFQFTNVAGADSTKASSSQNESVTLVEETVN